MATTSLSAIEEQHKDAARMLCVTMSGVSSSFLGHPVLFTFFIHCSEEPHEELHSRKRPTKLCPQGIDISVFQA